MVEFSDKLKHVLISFSKLLSNSKSMKPKKDGFSSFILITWLVPHQAGVAKNAHEVVKLVGCCCIIIPAGTKGLMNLW